MPDAPALIGGVEALEVRQLLSAVTGRQFIENLENVVSFDDSDSTHAQAALTSELQNHGARTANSLATPYILGPSSSTSDTTPTIHWTRSSGASRYHLYVSDLASGQAVVNRWVYGTSHTPALSAGRNYRTWVKAYTYAGTSSGWSAARDFKITAARPGTPSLTGPTSSTSDTTPNISWTGSSRAAKYQLYVADVGSGKVVVNRWVYGTSHSPSLTAGRNYRAWVKAFDSAGRSSGWSAARDFKISHPDYSRILYVNFDGASLSASQLKQWAAGEWHTKSNGRLNIDPESDGVTVQKFRGRDSRREQYISSILEQVRKDFSVFGVQVRRHYGLAVTGVGATTIFVGKPNIADFGAGVAASVDRGNNNRTDIGFVQDMDLGNFTNTVRKMAETISHEAGHTYGLIHTDTYSGGRIHAEVMGYQYTINDRVKRGLATRPGTFPDTSFLDRTFSEFKNHGFFSYKETQNSYRELKKAFSGTLASRRSQSNGNTADDAAGLHGHSHGGLHEHVGEQAMVVTDAAAADEYWEQRDGVDQQSLERDDGRSSADRQVTIPIAVRSTTSVHNVEDERDDRAEADLDDAAWIAFATNASHAADDNAACLESQLNLPQDALS